MPLKHRLHTVKEPINSAGGIYGNKFQLSKHKIERKSYASFSYLSPIIIFDLLICLALFYFFFSLSLVILFFPSLFVPLISFSHEGLTSETSVHHYIRCTTLFLHFTIDCKHKIYKWPGHSKRANKWENEQTSKQANEQTSKRANKQTSKPSFIRVIIMRTIILLIYFLRRSLEEIK